MDKDHDLVFSCRNEDKELAERLFQAMHSEGLQAWMEIPLPNSPREAADKRFGEAVSFASWAMVLITSDHLSKRQKDQVEIISHQKEVDPQFKVFTALLRGAQRPRWLPRLLSDSPILDLNSATSDIEIARVIASFIRDEPVQPTQDEAADSDAETQPGVEVSGSTAVPREALSARESGSDPLQATRQEGKARKSQRLRMPRIFMPREHGMRILAGYLVVAIFGLGYGVVRLAWPQVPTSTALIIGVLVAAPLALSLMWERLQGVTVFGVEVSLADVTVHLEQSLDVALTRQIYFSAAPAILEQVEYAMRNPDLELLEINLRSPSRSYWWSTRLFLQAALAEDFSNIRRLVFVERGDERQYVGMASPAAVRRALRDPGNLENAYREIRGDRDPKYAAPPQGEVKRIIESWTAHTFKRGNSPATEEQVRIFVGSQELVERLADQLERQSVELFTDPPRGRLLGMVLRKRTRFVALVRGGRLMCIVDADDLARRRALQ